MIDIYVDENGLIEMNFLVLVCDEVMYGIDKLLKFGEDSYQIINGWWFVLIFEVLLIYMVVGDVFEESVLLICMIVYILCFCFEVGFVGCDIVGMLCQYQFEKVEMVLVVYLDELDNE